MRLRARLTSFLRAVLFRNRMERDMEQEWRFHLDARIDDLVATGLPLADAAPRARIEFGDPRRWKEYGREARGLQFFDELRQDVVYATRQLSGAPLFTIVAVVTLALGIGANTAIFSVVNAVLVRPLPYPESDRLVMLFSAWPSQGIPKAGSALPDYREYRDQNHTLEGLGGFFHSGFNLSVANQTPERVEGSRVTSNLFSVLGVTPVLGQNFLPEDEKWGQHHVALLSYGLWQRQFSGNPNIVGRQINLNGTTYTVRGVMPQ